MSRACVRHAVFPACRRRRASSSTMMRPRSAKGRNRRRGARPRPSTHLVLGDRRQVQATRRSGGTSTSPFGRTHRPKRSAIAGRSRNWPVVRTFRHRGSEALLCPCGSRPRPPRNSRPSCPSRSRRRAGSRQSRRSRRSRATDPRPCAAPSPGSGLEMRRIGRPRHRLRRQRQGFEHALVDEPVDDAGRHAGLAAPPRLFARVRPSASRLSTRARAGVMRCGDGPASRTPIRTRSGPRCSPMRSAIRSTMPREDSV